MKACAIARSGFDGRWFGATLIVYGMWSSLKIVKPKAIYQCRILFEQLCIIMYVASHEEKIAVDNVIRCNNLALVWPGSHYRHCRHTEKRHAVSRSLPYRRGSPIAAPRLC